ncbi:hypothetical protein N9W34_06260, partial [Rickettsiales bacterium]|nr:hypothetical protein [Rickettsiales bacterium]
MFFNSLSITVIMVGVIMTSSSYANTTSGVEKIGAQQAKSILEQFDNMSDGDLIGGKTKKQILEDVKNLVVQAQAQDNSSNMQELGKSFQYMQGSGLYIDQKMIDDAFAAAKSAKGDVVEQSEENKRRLKKSEPMVGVNVKDNMPSLDSGASKSRSEIIS